MKFIYVSTLQCIQKIFLVNQASSSNVDDIDTSLTFLHNFKINHI